MTKGLEVYKCNVCGNIVEVLDYGAGTLVCCNEPMVLQEEKTEDAATEKHVPYIEKGDGKVTVRVGQNAAHPMEDKHFIQWIEVTCSGGVYRQALKPGDAPEATFDCGCGDVTAREYCNLHGLWKG